MHYILRNSIFQCFFNLRNISWSNEIFDFSNKEIELWEGLRQLKEALSKRNISQNELGNKILEIKRTLEKQDEIFKEGQQDVYEALGVIITKLHEESLLPGEQEQNHQYRSNKSLVIDSLLFSLF